MTTEISYQNSDWKRKFQPENVSWINRIAHRARAGFLKPSDVSRQAQFVDTNFYYRIGGVDALKARTRNDLLAIQAGIGSHKAVTLEDQISIAVLNDIPYYTWLIPDPDDVVSIENQILAWHSWPGVMDAPMVIDLEKPRSYTRMINKSELKTSVQTIQEISPYLAGCYSRVNLFEDVFPDGFENWFSDVWQWIAQYLLDSEGYQYRYYDPFLDRWEWSLPPSVTGSYLYQADLWRNNVKAWQLSDRGDAEYYIAPEWISPGQPGMKGCDLNVSLDPKNDFIDFIFGNAPPVTPPDPEICTFDFECIRSVNYRTAPLVSSSTYVGTFSPGKVVKCRLFENPTYADFWLEFEMSGTVYYSALVYNGTQFFKPI